MGGSPLLHRTLGQFRWGLYDPCCRLLDDEWMRATLTPDGPGAIRLTGLAAGAWRIEAHGPGGDWLADRAPGLAGQWDENSRVRPEHRVVADAQRAFGGLRLGRSGTPYHELLPAVLAQRITAREAARQWAGLVHEWGEPAPGPWGLMLPPRPSVMAGVPYFALHRLGIERSRARTLVAVARTVDSLGRGTDEDEVAPHVRTSRLTAIHGVGIWTAAVAGAVAYGDPDALPVGDFHVKNTVAWALCGRPRGTDEEMLVLMEPYAGQRLRVLRWLELAGWRAPRFGPGRRTPDIGSL